jgi:hypothetical protein
MNAAQQMQQEINAYFLAEKYESLLFVFVGIAAIGASVWLWTSASAFAATFRPMSYPLIAVAIIQIVVGGGVYLRTDGQMAALAAQATENPEAYKSEELRRMATVNKNFTVYKWIEIGLLFGAIGVTFAVSRNSAWYAAAIGMIIQASLMLIADLFAEHRAHHYVEAIQSLGS